MAEPPTPPADATDDADIRTTMLDAAERCFYRDGITATGVDALAAEAGVSKRTLYNHFESKDGLLLAYLQRREERWRQRLADGLEQAGDDPIDRILVYIREYGRPVSPDTEFRGCAFINAAAELSTDGDPSLEVVRNSIDHIEHGLAEILRGARVDDPEGLAHQILMALEGLVAVGGIRRTRREVATAEDLVRTLVGAHVHEPV